MLTDFLAGDKQLYTELQYDLRQFAEQQKGAKKQAEGGARSRSMIDLAPNDPSRRRLSIHATPDKV